MESAADKASEIKRKILSHIERNGPSLPVAISREVGISSLFSSAFLSELLEDESIKISKMKVGGSPLYFLPQQHPMLENFSRYLPEKEKEALHLLKERKVLKDIEQEPAIRIALRSLKDFASPIVIEQNNAKEVYWRYVMTNENEAKHLISESIAEILQPARREIQISQPVVLKHDSHVQVVPGIQKLVPRLDIFNKEPVRTEKPVKAEKIKKEKFSDEVKAFLEKRNMRILEIDKLDKKEVTAKIKLGEKEVLLYAVDKKRVDESDLIKAHKKSQLMGISYFILTRGETTKKLKDAIDAYKNLERIEKIE
jgi:DNA-binding Lrp family transcriptional regulator